MSHLAQQMCLVATLFAFALLSTPTSANFNDSCWQGLPRPPTTAAGQAALSCAHYDDTNGAGMTQCFYAAIKTIVRQYLDDDPTNAGPLLRLSFHDAFINGADASILLTSSYNETGGNAEKDATINTTLDGFDIIDDIKEKVEPKCGPISCADIIQIAAMWVVHIMGGPQQEIPLGRLDGCISQSQTAPRHLPSPQAIVRGAHNGAPFSLINHFKVQGLDTLDLVVLSGSHTLGQAHCSNYKDRIGYGGLVSPVPMNATLKSNLQACCIHQKALPGNPAGSCVGNISSPVLTDAPQTDLEAGNRSQAVTWPPTGGGLTFDNSYFKNLQQKMGLLTSDQALFSDPSTKGYVDLFAADQPAFFSAWKKSFVRMGAVLPADMKVLGGVGVPPCTTVPLKGLPACQAYSKNAFGIRQKTCSTAKYSSYCKNIA